MRLTEDEKEELTTLLNEAGERGEYKVHQELLIFHARALGIGEAINVLEELFNQGH